MKVQSQQRSYFRWLSIRHKTITLHRHQKDFLDKLVVKKNSLKETFKQRKLLRTRFGKKHIREEFLPWKSKLCSCVSSFFSWQVWFVQNWNVRGFLRWTETSFFLNFIYTTKEKLSKVLKENVPAEKEELKKLCLERKIYSWFVWFVDRKSSKNCQN